MFMKTQRLRLYCLARCYPEIFNICFFVIFATKKAGENLRLLLYLSLVLGRDKVFSGFPHERCGIADDTFFINALVVY